MQPYHVPLFSQSLISCDQAGSTPPLETSVLFTIDLDVLHSRMLLHPDTASSITRSNSVLRVYSISYVTNLRFLCQTTALGTDSMGRATRPAYRGDFEIAIICALILEADAVVTLFDEDWDDGDEAEHAPYDKAHGDPNAYSAGRIGRHDVVVAHMPSMGKVSAATVAANCRTSWPNIKLALVVGICGAVPFDPQSQNEIILGDVIVSDGVVQYDLGRRLPDRFVRKDTLLDSLGRPNTEIRSLLAKLKGMNYKQAAIDHGEKLFLGVIRLFVLKCSRSQPIWRG